MSGAAGVFPALFFGNIVEEKIETLNRPYVVKQSFYISPAHTTKDSRTYIKRGHRLVLQIHNQETDMYSFDIILEGAEDPVHVSLDGKTVNTYLRLACLPNHIWNAINT